MSVNLKKLELTNYRNIQHAIYEFDGNSKIVGENRIGKTNTLEAIVWLLTDKLLNGSSDVAQIKPLRDTKEEVSVSGEFDIDGKTIVICKVYGEDWVKTRGTDDLIFKGHYLKYFYNGVLQKTKRDFYALFNEDFGLKGEFKGIDLAQMLVDPFYIGNMGEGDSWKDLRAFIIALIGDVDDNAVFEKNPSLKPIQSDLNLRGGRIDELKKYYQNNIKGFEEQIVGDDAQIKMCESITTPSPTEVAIAKKGLSELEEDVAKLQNEKGSDVAIINIDRQINEIQSQILSERKKDMDNSEKNVINQELRELNENYHVSLSKKAAIQERRITLDTQLKDLKEKVADCDTLREGFIKELRDIDAEISKPFLAECPTCHRPLEGDELEKAKKEHELDLLTKKTIVLNKGKENKERKISMLEKIENLESEYKLSDDSLQRVLNECQETLKLIEEKNNFLNVIESSNTEFNSTIALLEEKIKELEIKKRQVTADMNAANVAIAEQIDEKVAQMEPYKKVLNDDEYAKRMQSQLENIRLIKKQHNKDLIDCEQKKELVNFFIKTKLEMLDENVKRVFGNIKFQLIKENINGGYDPICKPFIYDIDKEESTTVTWRSGSKSERVITGIAICEKIKTALGLADLPFLFDEGGEISTDTFNNKFKTNSQLICVKVMDNIKTPMVMKI